MKYLYLRLLSSEAAISQIVQAIRFGTRETYFGTYVPPFRYLRFDISSYVLQCAVFPHTPVHPALRSLLILTFFSSSIYHQITFETCSENDGFLLL